jgi:arylsulfatase A-like enzyme
MAQQWIALLPPEKYHTPLPDDNPYEIPLKDGLHASLPIDLDSLRKAGAGLDLLMATPWGNTITTDMALAAIDGEGMGTDDITDLLAISYSSTDILGHKTGPRAIELEDLYIRLDQEIARLIDSLDKKVGRGKYTLFLTADHGAVDVPAYLKDMKASAGYDDLVGWEGRLTKPFPAQVSGGTLWIDTIVNGQVYLRPAYSGMARSIAELMRTFPEVSYAAAAMDLADGAQGDGIAEMVANGIQVARCGDVLFTLRPGYFEKEPWNYNHGTTHGSPWSYDTHVPVIFYGAGVEHTEVLRPTTITDIAPTISAIIGMAPPDAADGGVVEEAIRRP